MKTRMRLLQIGLLILALAASGALTGLAQNESDPIQRGFLNPPDSAKPRVWWHWMNGNISKEGIKADLEWMKRAGIGGFQNFDAGMSTRNIVDKRLVYMTPEWKDAFKYAATLADQLGLEMAIASSPGWSESGGPWVQPEQAMKKFVWAETRIEGGKPFLGKLAQPPHEVGPFQNIAGGGGGPDGGGPSNQALETSDNGRDFLVVASFPGGARTISGMSYRLLVLDKNTQRMPLAVLRKIRDYVNSGAAVAGPKPTESPSLMDDQIEYKRIADELWGAGSGERTVGKGKVFSGMSASEAVKALQLPPDFEYTKPQSDTIMMFVHRKVSDGEIYWVNNRRKRDENVEGTFRVTGKTPEIWHADTGVIEPVSFRTVGGRTVVPLHLNENDAVFVIFRKPATAPSHTVAEMMETQLAAMEGAWEVAFQPNRGAPAKATFDKLASWTENSDAGIKYFSGTATYTKNLQASAAWFRPGEQIWLDLGDVQNIAEVAVNGKQVAAVWRKPFRVNLTGILESGANTVEVKVTNVWVNRLIGDQQLGAQKITYTAQQPYRADSPLLPSGLLGPVKVVSLGR